MRQFLIRYSILLSSLLTGCAAAHYDLQKAEGNTGCVWQLVPDYQKNWFTASIDVRGHHLSGLLLIKKMPDNTKRIVFTNELGVSFFDFEFSTDGFKVIQIIDKLDRKAVINTLRQDFELLLLQGASTETIKKYQAGMEFYYAYPWNKKINYVVTKEDCGLLRLERGSERKKLVQIEFEGDHQNPNKITVLHYNFDMQIVLTKIDR